PADKRAPLAKELGELVQQISDVGVCVYVSKKNGAEADVTTLPLLSAVGGTANPILIAKVNEPTTFLDGAGDFLNHAKRAAKIAGDVKSEINYQEKDIAGKPSRLFNITVAAGGETTRSSLLLTALDNKTVLGCVIDGAKPEDVISTYSKAAQKS